MAEVGRREKVNDPLANNAFAQMPDRSLSLSGVRNPGQTSGAPNDPGFAALGQLGAALGDILEVQKEEWNTEGKVQFMQGKSLEEVEKSGNKYTVQGWQALNTADAAARWYGQEMSTLQNGGYQQSPEEYSKGLMERRAQFMKDLPDDPAVRKLYVAAFDDYGPRLAASHAEVNNAYNTQQTEAGFSSLLKSGSAANADATRVMPGNSPLRLSPGVVRKTVAYDDADVDTLALTMLGEAGGEGPTGMSAVAHVIVNRAIDGGFGGSKVRDVALKEKQFSTWNAGPGGNDPQRFRGTRAYEEARNIAVQVLSGHNVDPTNGATYYYSPDGMADLVRGGSQTNLTPAWYGEQNAKYGTTSIGGHRFTGRAKNLGYDGAMQTNGAKKGGLIFNHAGQEGIQEEFGNILRDVSAQMGTDLTITSGFRSKEYNASVGGANDSRHSHGDAADIDMTGMDNNQRAALVQSLRARGVKRFGTYDKHPNMLHVDMSTTNGDNWFMHNKSNKNIAGAPQWFQQVAGSPIPALDVATASTGGRDATVVNDPDADGVQVAEATGIPTAETPSIAQSQVQELVRGFGNIPPQRRGQLLAEAMVDQLELGDDQLYNDAGGEAFLREMGAPEDAVQKVAKARKTYSDKKLNGWNVENLKWENDLVLSVGAGEVAADVALTQIDAKVQSNRMTEEHAKSLANNVLAASQRVGKQPVNNPEAMRAVTEVYRGVVNELLTPEQADAKIRQIAKVHEMPETQVNQIIGEMWNNEQSSILKTKNAVQEAEKKRIEQERRKAAVEQAVANGTGLSDMDGIGTIDVQDKALGTTRSLSPTQYGVETIREQTAQWVQQEAKRMASDEGIDPETAMDRASVLGEARLYEQLRKQNVVDEAGALKLRGSLIGEVVKDGKVNPAAAEALDFYTRMAKNPNVGEEYMAGMLQDPQARALVETARTLMEARHDVGDALLRAYTMLSDPNIDVNRKIANDGAFSGKVEQEVAALMNDKLGVRGFWGTFLNPLMGDHQFRQEDIDDAKASEANVGLEIKRRAQSYYIQNPRMNVETSVKMAAQDAKRDATIAGTSVVFGDANKNERLDQVMGLSKFGPRATTDAIDWFLEQRGEKVFGALWSANAQNSGWTDFPRTRRFVDNLTLGLTSGEGFDHRPFESIRYAPKYDVTYTPQGEDGFITVQLRNSDNQLVGKPYPINAAELGRLYLEDTDAKEASWANRGVLMGVDAVAGGIRAMREVPVREPDPNTPADYLNRLSGGKLFPKK